MSVYTIINYISYHMSFQWFTIEGAPCQRMNDTRLLQDKTGKELEVKALHSPQPKLLSQIIFPRLCILVKQAIFNGS